MAIRRFKFEQTRIDEERGKDAHIHRGRDKKRKKRRQGDIKRQSETGRHTKGGRERKRSPRLGTDKESGRDKTGRLCW